MWTWVCANSRCEKQEKPRGTTESVSLETCNMLCGSTQFWPQPTGPMHLSSIYVTFHMQQLRFEIAAQDEQRSLLEQAYNIFKSNIQALIGDDQEAWSIKADINKFIIKVLVSSATHKTLNLNTDESYNLTVYPMDGDLVATIRSKSYFGARHGLETLSQLIWSDDTSDGVILKTLKGATIQDAPVFPYRGLMLDTARQFFSVDSLKRVLIGMSACKLNVFHWHLTDSQSFPFDSPRRPQMAKYGASSPEMVYTAEDVKDVVEFARVRGIRVIMEIDTPAHAGNGWNWGPEHGLGKLALCVNQQPWSLYCGEPPCGQLNPDNPNIYLVLHDLYKDILELSKEKEIFHLGGDEVNLNCWDQYLPKKTPVNSNYTYIDLHDTWGEFTVRAIKTLQQANDGKSMSNIIMWSSDLTKKPYVEKYLNKKKIIVQIWGGSTWPETTDLLADGYRVIISHVDAWYLDCGFGNWRETGQSACDPYKTWQRVYKHRPWQTLRLKPDKRALILGGEACLWAEQVDEVSLDTRLWPRVAALAERLWTDPHSDRIDSNTENVNSAESQGDTVNEDVYTRLVTQRQRLIKRGLEAEAMWPQWCVQNPGMCL